MYPRINIHMRAFSKLSSGTANLSSYLHGDDGVDGTCGVTRDYLQHPTASPPTILIYGIRNNDKLETRLWPAFAFAHLLGSVAGTALDAQLVSTCRPASVWGKRCWQGGVGPCCTSSDHTHNAIALQEALPSLMSGAYEILNYVHVC